MIIQIVELKDGVETVLWEGTRESVDAHASMCAEGGGFNFLFRGDPAYEVKMIPTEAVGCSLFGALLTPTKGKGKS